LASHRPSRKSNPENAALSVLLMFEEKSDSTYSKHGAVVNVAGERTGMDEAALSSTLCEQYELCNRRTVRKTFDNVKANTLAILKFHKRHA
jgi:hypothetical protein